MDTQSVFSAYPTLDSYLALIDKVAECPPAMVEKNSYVLFYDGKEIWRGETMRSGADVLVATHGVCQERYANRRKDAYDHAANIVHCYVMEMLVKDAKFSGYFSNMNPNPIYLQRVSLGVDLSLISVSVKTELVYRWAKFASENFYYASKKVDVKSLKSMVDGMKKDAAAAYNTYDTEYGWEYKCGRMQEVWHDGRFITLDEYVANFR